jgi:hypothetical protein
MSLIALKFKKLKRLSSDNVLFSLRAYCSHQMPSTSAKLIEFRLMLSGKSDRLPSIIKVRNVRKLAVSDHVESFEVSFVFCVPRK